MVTDPQKEQDSKKKPLDNYIRYSAMSFQMAATVLLLTLGGIKLDEYFNTKPVLTIILCLISIVAALYLALKDFIRK
jgi:F0F1-type ATP synthase assembly protein I